MGKSTCWIDGCDRTERLKRGLCGRHYQQAAKDGTLDNYRRPPDPPKYCKVDDCGSLAKPGRQGMCGKHAERMRRTGSTADSERPQQNGILACSIEGCDKVSKAGGRTGQLLCSMHYDRLRKHGDVGALGRQGNCEVCGATFYQQFSKQKTCGKKCSRERFLAYNREFQEQWRSENPRPPVDTYPAKCLWCRADFDATRRQFRYCSRDCHLLHRGRSDYPYVAKRKQWVRETRGQRFTRGEILERDGWMCWLCAQPIDPECVYPDAYSASLDHVVPLSKGGTHTPENVRAAHLTCNVRKGSKVVRN